MIFLFSFLRDKLKVCIIRPLGEFSKSYFFTSMVVSFTVISFSKQTVNI